LIELRVDDASTTLYKLVVTTTLLSEYIDPTEWTGYASRTFVECLPPTGTAASYS
jgi:hypothetical protein